MADRSYRYLLLFVDGIGLAPAGDANPFATAATPCIDRLLGGPLTLGASPTDPCVVLRPLDACLGVDGLPQSATGQTSLFTGVNAQAAVGHHVTALPGPQLRDILTEHSLFRRAVELGARTTFANAYGARYLQMLDTGKRRPSASTCAVRAAGIELRTLEDLQRGEAVTWDICGDRFAALAEVELKPMAPSAAGRTLGRLASQHDLTLFETFLSDLAGHGRAEPHEAVERIDGLLAGVLDEMCPTVTVVLTSDHGNLEDRSTRSHTTHPVPLLAVGPRAHRFADLTRLTDVAPRLSDELRRSVGDATRVDDRSARG